jgi:membrane protease subunit HflC
LRREIAGRNFGEIVGNERDPMVQEVASRVRGLTHEFGIEIVDVRIKRADLPTEVQESVFARMRAEREREAKRYRSEGEEKAITIRAETDKETEIIVQEARAKAEKIRGEGDAEGIRIYADAYNQDPEFYAFQRSLAAYEKALDEKASVVLSTRSDLFRYMGGPQKRR